MLITLEFLRKQYKDRKETLQRSLQRDHSKELVSEIRVCDNFLNNITSTK